MDAIEEKKFGEFTVKLYNDQDPECPLEWDNDVFQIEIGRYYELRQSKYHFYSEVDFLLFLAQEIHPNFPDEMKCAAKHREQCEAIANKYFVWSGDVNQNGRTISYLVARKDTFGKDPQKGIDAFRKTYLAWANGECVGFKTFDTDGEEIDSCWGFYSMEEACEHAKENFPTRDDQYYFDLYENQ